MTKKVTVIRKFVKAQADQASVVWNPKVNKPLARFSKNGPPFETDSSTVAGVLIEMGYKEITPAPEVPDVCDSLKEPFEL